MFLSNTKISHMQRTLKALRRWYLYVYFRYVCETMIEEEKVTDLGENRWVVDIGGVGWSIGRG